MRREKDAPDPESVAEGHGCVQQFLKVYLVHRIYHMCVTPISSAAAISTGFSGGISWCPEFQACRASVEAVTNAYRASDKALTGAFSFAP
ncbi:MAG TPA: hypothetical protein VHB49_22185 [Bradyrhizobium sp.]|nr:hypothetical protein [Bradyrhizobium sp.]